MLPAWAPSLEQVGDYVTSRTVDSTTVGSDSPTGTFTPNTYPTDAQVQRLVEGACSWVTNVTGPVDPTLEDAAGSVAALRAAAMVEASYPLRNADVDAVANSLLQEAKTARAELVAANRAKGAVGINPSGAPAFGFPDPQAWRGNEPSRLPRSVNANDIFLW